MSDIVHLKVISAKCSDKRIGEVHTDDRRDQSWYNSFVDDVVRKKTERGEKIKRRKSNKRELN